MRPNALMAVLLATAGLMPTAVSAGTSKPQPVRCPTHYVCSMSLGVGIRPPATWLALPKGKEGPYTIAFARRPVAGTSYDKRLIVKLVVVGNSLNDRGLAREEAKRLVAGLHARGVTMAAVRYGGSPGFLLRGLPATPSPALQIVGAHRSYVYLLIAPGTALAADQRQALASLVFFQPRGAPPPGNSIP